jgi:hypothetical protein
MYTAIILAALLTPDAPGGFRARRVMSAPRGITYAAVQPQIQYGVPTGAVIQGTQVIYGAMPTQLSAPATQGVIYVIIPPSVTGVPMGAAAPPATTGAVYGAAPVYYGGGFAGCSGGSCGGGGCSGGSCGRRR